MRLSSSPPSACLVDSGIEPSLFPACGKNTLDHSAMRAHSRNSRAPPHITFFLSAMQNLRPPPPAPSAQPALRRASGNLPKEHAPDLRHEHRRSTRRLECIRHVPIPSLAPFE